MSAPDPGVPRVLAHGIDSLNLAIDLEWRDSETFERLARLKESAKNAEKDAPVEFSATVGILSWRFTVKPHGSEGYAWVLVGNELSMRIGQWRSPRQRPSAMVEIRSEALWRFGPQAAVERVQVLLDYLGADLCALKPSRLDLCADILLEERDWHAGLQSGFVTRARGINQFFDSHKLTGFKIGRGQVSARLYDKPLEIRSRSNKQWMFGIWGIDEVPDGHRIIRVEFQLRRRALREFGLDAWDEVSERTGRLWSHCTRLWLRVVDDARKHHTVQRLLPWWEIVQDGFDGAQSAAPLVREAAITRDKQRIAAQTAGGLLSMISLSTDHGEDLSEAPLDQKSFFLAALDETLRNIDLNDDEFAKRIERKRAKYSRSEDTLDSDWLEEEDRA